MDTRPKLSIVCDAVTASAPAKPLPVVFCSALSTTLSVRHSDERVTLLGEQVPSPSPLADPVLPVDLYRAIQEYVLAVTTNQSSDAITCCQQIVHLAVGLLDQTVTEQMSMRARLRQRHLS